MNTTTTFHIRTISPIHIGCDEVYEPMSFVIDEQNDVLVSFDPTDFLKGLDDQGRLRFSEICKKGTVESILEIYRFMRGRNCLGHRVNICPGFKKHYQETLSISPKDGRRIRRELNSFVISRTAFNPVTNQPYLPGSSIKGALRTAWLNLKQKEKKLQPKGASRARELEQELLDGGSFSTDPFRTVKVSDFMPVGEVKTRIVYAVNEKKKVSTYKARGLAQIVEVIEPGSVFEGSISISSPLKESRIVSPVDIQGLMDSAVRFYLGEKDAEDKILVEIGAKPVKAEVPDRGFILRIGRHSGAECLTIEGHRSIRIMKGKPPGKLERSTTLWLSAQDRRVSIETPGVPFGWVSVSPGPASVQKTVGTAPQKSPVENILDELAHIKPHEMGRIGTVIQMAEKLPDVRDRAAVAAAIREKIGPKVFKKHKRRELLEEWLKGE
ncbi:MAG: type III-A CRISPR-associated RAMP protein Csm5 [Desulfomonilia bacterium]|jgi:CRISPR-associated protein Csm5